MLVPLAHMRHCALIVDHGLPQNIPVSKLPRSLGMLSHSQFDPTVRMRDDFHSPNGAGLGQN
jgi:hypothetical protein